MSRYSTCLCRYRLMEHTNKMERRLMSLPSCILMMDITCAYCSMRGYIFSVFSLCFRLIYNRGAICLRGASETQVSFQARVAHPDLHVAHAHSADTAVALHFGDPGRRR